VAAGVFVVSAATDPADAVVSAAFGAVAFESAELEAGRSEAPAEHASRTAANGR
jgi:hypothetical protein